MTYKIHCSREYRKGVGTIISETLLATRTGILDNEEEFPDSPITEAESKEIYTTFVNAKSYYDRGGISQETPWKTAEEAAIALLDKEADYVDDIAQGNSLIIILSGFTPTEFSTGRKSNHKPRQPQHISTNKNIPEGQISCWCEAHDENDSYGCFLSEGRPLPDGFWMMSNGIFKTTPDMPVIYHNINLQRKKLFTELKWGVKYWLYFYIVNTAGVSPLSAGVCVSCG